MNTKGDVKTLYPCRAGNILILKALVHVIQNTRFGRELQLHVVVIYVLSNRIILSMGLGLTNTHALLPLNIC